MSTPLQVYLNYMSTWDDESDAHIDPLLDEHRLFRGLGDFDSDTAVNKEFKTLDKLACKVRDETIAADVVQIAADAAAVAALWSFGLSMAVFATLEATEAALQSEISSKSKELNDKLKSADTDIANGINENVSKYIAKYKENNELIKSKAAKGMDTQHCRAILMQFMAEVEKKKTLTASSFRLFADSAKRLYNSKEISAVYDALDDLNLSDRTDADLKKFMDFLAAWTFPDKWAVDLVHSACIVIMSFKIGIANERIARFAREAGIPRETIEESAFDVMDGFGKFVTVVAVVMSVVDVVFEIMDIVNVIEKCKVMCDKLNGEIKQSYLDYFNGIKTASKKYNAAIAKYAKE